MKISKDLQRHIDTSDGTDKIIKDWEGTVGIYSTNPESRKKFVPLPKNKEATLAWYMNIVEE